MSTGYQDFNTLVHSRNPRLETLVKIRWIAIGGQTAAVLIVWIGFGFELPITICLLLIFLSVLLNLVLGSRFPRNARLGEPSLAALLGYDAVQLAALLFLTGGLGNPFAFLLAVPVIISSSTLPIRWTAILGTLVVVLTTVLANFHLPLPWVTYGGLVLPFYYILGMWVAITSSLLFTSAYAFRLADEARKLGEALNATELVLQREQYLSNLDGLAAAAAHELGTPLSTISLVSKELLWEVEKGTQLEEDAKLLRSQAERCREILGRLKSLSSQGDYHIANLPFSGILDEVTQPHQEFGIEILVELQSDGDEPQCRRNPGILYGLGNLVENAVDHAATRVLLNAGWDNTRVWLTISDDGPGFSDEVVQRVGEPFVTNRARANRKGGLGLGLFIAKTLLERSGASITFKNSINPRQTGAVVRIEWQRESLEAMAS